GRVEPGHGLGERGGERDRGGRGRVVRRGGDRDRRDGQVDHQAAGLGGGGRVPGGVRRRRLDVVGPLRQRGRHRRDPHPTGEGGGERRAAAGDGVRGGRVAGGAGQGRGGRVGGQRVRGDRRAGRGERHGGGGGRGVGVAGRVGRRAGRDRDRDIPVRGRG